MSILDRKARAVLAAAVWLGMLATGCGGGGTAATPTPDDGAWQRIQSVGQLIVGVSPDYPPFAYLANGARFDGFDVALMRDLGRRLGVQVGFINFAFDGLGGALQLGQIDVAVGGISVTPERQQKVDFSSVYYVGEDAILAAAGAGIGAVSTVADMAGRRVGVLRGSVYETWLAPRLPPDKLMSYLRQEDAVRDLREQRVDLIVLDLLPAQAYAREGGVTLVGSGLDPQRLAIALPKGAWSLKTRIDQALAQSQADGVVGQLAQQYLGVQPGQSLPTPTPGLAPAATGAPSRDCVDGLALVQDLTYDDRDMAQLPVLEPGQSFVKAWRVRNSGTCAWYSNYQIAFVEGVVATSRMGGQDMPLGEPVLQDTTFDLRVTLTAPAQPGIYTGYWQLRNASGQPFGERLGVAIRVPVVPTATPAPTAPPSTAVQFSADRGRIRQGERVVLSWQAGNAQAVYLYAQGEAWQTSGVPADGQREVYPQATTVYELRAVRADGGAELRQVRIDVTPATNPPQISQFAVLPQWQIIQGQCLTLQWDVRGQVTRVTILKNNTPLWAGAPAKGAMQDCPTVLGNTDYRLQADGPGGTNYAQQDVWVLRR